MEARAMRAFDVSDPSRGSPVPSQSSRKWYVGAVCWAGFDSTRAEVEIQIPLRGGICGRRGRRQFGEFGGGWTKQIAAAAEQIREQRPSEQGKLTLCTPPGWDLGGSCRNLPGSG